MAQKINLIRHSEVYVDIYASTSLCAANDTCSTLLYQVTDWQSEVIKWQSDHDKAKLRVKEKKQLRNDLDMECQNDASTSYYYIMNVAEVCLRFLEVEKNVQKFQEPCFENERKHDVKPAIEYKKAYRTAL